MKVARWLLRINKPELYPIITLKPGREKSAFNFHPWIFSGAVKTLPKADNGSIVAVQTADNNLIGYGFLDTESQITCRIFHFNYPVQNIEPVFDADYWQGKIAAAYKMRKQFIFNRQTDSCRIINAEGDGLPGLIADLYGGQLAVIQLLIKGTENLASEFASAFRALGIPHIFLKNKQNTGVETTGSGWIGTPLPSDEAIPILENGLSFVADYVKGQKTGFFLDQRDNRALVQAYSQGRKVLNAFSYTGGFSVYALKGGAKQVISVDISAEATNLCNRNVSLNFPNAAHKAITSDCFDYIRNSGETFDLIVLDPPAFAKNAHAVHNAARGYKELAMAAIRQLKPGGILFTFSCSQHIDRDLFRKITFGAASDVGRSVKILNQLSQPADHPINIYHPEGEYLKGLVLFIE